VGVKLGVYVAEGGIVMVGVSGVVVCDTSGVGVGLGEDVPSLVGVVVPVVAGLGVVVADVARVGVGDPNAVGDPIPPLVGVGALGGVLEASGLLGNGEATDRVGVTVGSDSWVLVNESASKNAVAGASASSLSPENALKKLASGALTLSSPAGCCSKAMRVPATAVCTGPRSCATTPSGAFSV
jgi:hypothetical protein